MGQVFRARDTKLDRDVAIKILSEAFAHDADRLERFQREARTLASLNHPNIAAVHGLEESGGVTALVMELVEGDDLSQRIARGAIPLDEALPIAKQIAEALEAAHEQSIVHRDLKPANIMLRPDGVVKVLDFGLAKAPAPVSPGGGLYATESPTIASPAMTGVGVLMGTAAYMSPEQAKGRSADKRSDVWAFGCVLFEMLTGRRVFEGDTTAEALSGVLKSEPNWQLLPAHTPLGLRRLLRRCLQKDGRLRLHDIADARLDLDELQSEPRTHLDGIPGTPRRNPRFVWIVATAVLLVAGVAASVSLLRSPSSSPERRVEITTPPTLDPVTLSISPDGEKVAFVATFEGRSLLWVRSLVSGSSRHLPGTDYAQYPFWSPDSRAIGFFAGGKLHRIDVDGGSAQTLANAQAGIGGTWNQDGTILFGTSNGRPISRLSATGGMPVDVTKVEARQATHRFPQWLPDGRHFLYYVTGSPDVRGIHVGQLDGSPGRRLLDTDTLAVNAAGHLLFVRQGTLFARAFDQERLQLTGDEFRVAEHVAINARIAGELGLSASTTGSIAFRTASGAGQRRVEWFDRSGKQIGALGADIEGFSPALSPDDRRVAFYQTRDGDQDIWWLEHGRGVGLRLTTDPSGDNSPLWSRDGSRVLFSTNRTGTRSIFEKSITVTGGDTLVLQTGQNVVPLDWSPDGDLLYRSNDPKTNFDIWVLSAGDGKRVPVVRTSSEEREAQFSPDGKWIAYQSNQSGRFEIYVQPFPGPGTPLPISSSSNGGAQVRWRRDGKELFYIALDGGLMAVPVKLSSDGTIDAGTPVRLFFTRIVGGPLQGTDPHQYAVSRDGQRFLISTVTEVDNSPITVILNWKGKP